MDIFKQFDLEKIKQIRKLFINNIIATDMANHKIDMKRLNDMVTTENCDVAKSENKEFLMTQLIHFSDISNGTKPFEIYQKWVDKLFVEFFLQGDKEKEMNLPISFLCDRDKTNIPDSQVFFINAFTLDLTSSLALAYPKFYLFVKRLEENRKLWEEKKGTDYQIDED
jgi:hypothetical protein